MSQMGRTEGDAASYFMNFNQDCSSLAVGSRTGFNLYSLATIDTNVEEIYGSHGEDICLVERLFSSSLVALVSLNAPRKLKVCHYKKGTEICNYSYSNTILAVRLNRARLIVCLEESLYIHNIRDMKVVHTIRDTPPNCSGLCALAADAEHCYLAYPGSARTGEVQIFDAVNLHAKTMIPAHESPLAAIAFNPNGSEIATASEKGTVIRVFNVHDGTKLFEFRRGMKRCVSIASLSFSTCAKYLCCSSNTETVHIFKLDPAAGDSVGPAAGSCCAEAPGLGALGGVCGATAERPERVAPAAPVKEDWMGYLTKTVSSYLPLALPAQVTDVFTQGRAFALAVLPVIGMRHSCVITSINRSLKLLVASQEGYLYVYQVPSVEGGECRLIIRHDLRTTPELVPTTTSNNNTTNGGGSLASGTDAQSIASLETTAEPTAPVPIPLAADGAGAGATTISPDAYSVMGGGSSGSVSPPASVATTVASSRGGGGGGSVSDAEDEYLGL